MVVHPMPSPEEQMAMKERRDAIAPLTWNRLGGITTTAATLPEDSMAKVRINTMRDGPWFHDRYPVEESELRPGKRIALVGGGPSIKDTVAELMDFSVIMACGSVHDWLQDHSPRVPTYTAICDPDPVMANYLRRPNLDTTYLLASQCDTTVFDALEGQNIVQWHCWPIGVADQAAKDFLQDHTPGWVAIGGGCTIGLRALTLALMMGYTEIHFFGFDSCMGMTDDEHHAYPFTDVTKEFLGDIYNVKIGMGLDNGPEVREYRVAGYQLAQAEHYKQSLIAFGHLFKPKFHGPGLLADMQRMIDLESQRLKEKEELAA
jgi:uncharacterized Rossmann fold enzyme